MIEMWYSWLLDYGKNKQISKLTLVLSRNTGPSISFDFLFHLLESSLCVAQICPLPGFSFVHFRYSIGLALCFFCANHIIFGVLRVNKIIYFFDWFKITISLAFVCNFQNLVSKSRFKRVTGLEYRSKNVAERKKQNY